MTARKLAWLSRRYPDAVHTAFAEHFDTVTNPDDVPRSAAELLAAIASCDVFVPTVSDPITAALLEHPQRRAQIVANVGVGVNHIDLAAASRAGVIVTNTPDVLTDDTADLTIGLMLMTARRLSEGERVVRAGNWKGLAPTYHLGRTLNGRTLGIIGYGRIGRAVAHRARSLGMRIRWVGRTSSAGAGSDPERATSLDELLAESDVVSLHAPATPDTAHLINADRLAQMRPGSMLINTARGSLVDETALAAALRSGHLYAAGLDVHEFEPRINAELLTMENVVLLPHLGSATIETRTAMGLRALQNAVQWLHGEAPRDRVA